MKSFLSFIIAILIPGMYLVANAQQKQIPELQFIDTENNSYTTKDIPEDHAFMLIYFRTDCDECRHMAQMLAEHADKYPLTIWMVSPNDIETLGTFEYMTGLLQKENIHILQDNQKLMHTWFDFKSLPFTVLFDKAGNQIARYDSLPDAETVTGKLNPQTNENR